MPEPREEMLHLTAKARERIMIDRLLDYFHEHKDEILKEMEKQKQG